MGEKKRFDNVWEALEDDPIRMENLKLRSALMIKIGEKIKAQKLTQKECAKRLHITQPRVSALLQGRIDAFRLDSLVDMAHRLGLQVSIKIAA